MNSARYYILGGLFIAAFIFSLVHNPRQKELLTNPSKVACSQQYRNDGIVKFNKNIIRVEIVKTAKEMEKGLGGRTCIGANQGMLFIFDQSDFYPFWMKDMKFPIDIVWLDSEKKVVYIKSDISPTSYPQTFVGTEPARFVLELQAGRALGLGLQPGSQVQF